MRPLKLGSLCSGYGGLELGIAEVLDVETAWVSDIDKGACKILAHRYPEVPNIGDMTTVDWSAVEPVDVLCGGTPCQDLSHAGKRAGMTEGTRSNLWVAMREAIATIRPSLVVWENVRGAYSAEADSALESEPGLLDRARRRDGEPVLRALGRVLGDLSDLGYDTSWHGLRAADVGAPHGRFRVFIVASSADTNDTRPWDAGRKRRGWSGVEYGVPRGDLLLTPAVNDMGAGKTVEAWDEWTADMQARHGNGNGHGKSLAIEAQRLLPTPRASDGPDPSSHGRTWSKTDRSMHTIVHLGEVDNAQWGDYTTAIAAWERALGRPAPAPTMTSTKGNPQLSPAFVEWMMGLPAGWVADVPGITRNEALKALGNGVVPQQAAAALREMFAWEAAA